MSEDTKKILIVDDDESLCRLLNAHLTSKGYEVEVAFDGEDGLARVEKFRPDLVILDLLLPGMEGFEVCRRIRENPLFSSIRVIMLTAVYMSEEDKLAGFRLGASNFLVKPDLILSKPMHLKKVGRAVDAVLSGSVEPLAGTPPPDRILVVDDDESNVRLMKMRLMSEGFEVESATSGREALEKIEPFQPHIVLLDIQMPTMSGLEVLKAIRDKGHQEPVVMMTAYGSESIAVEAFEDGADDYLIKPFDSGAAAKRIRQLIDGHRLREGKKGLTDRLKVISLDLINRVNHLENQNKRLEEAYGTVRGFSEFNRRFIKSLNTELRAPLNMIISFSGLLRDTPREKRERDKEKEMLAAIFRTAFRLELNLSNLITLSRIQAGAFEVVPTSFLLEPILEEVLVLLKKTRSRDDVSITWYPETKKHRLKGDTAIFKDILTNLLDTSLQRVDGPGEITLELLHPQGSYEDGETKLLLRVRDNGIGFTESELVGASVLDQDPETLKGGAESLRLHLCRHLANLLGWRLELSNRPTGGGEAVLTVVGSDSE